MFMMMYIMDDDWNDILARHYIDQCYDSNLMTPANSAYSTFSTCQESELGTGVQLSETANIMPFKVYQSWDIFLNVMLKYEIKWKVRVNDGK